MHQRAADRAFDPDFELGQPERRGQHLLDSLGRLERVVDAAAQRDQDAEFVAAGARQDVAARSAEIRRRAKVISSSSPARRPCIR